MTAGGRGERGDVEHMTAVGCRSCLSVDVVVNVRAENTYPQDSWG
jgi:hypothetical protein